MSVVLSPDELAALRAISTPTISNAIELFNVRPRTAGYASKDVRCLFPELGVTVGYAATVIVEDCPPDARPDWSRFFEVYERLAEVPAPRVLVAQDRSTSAGQAAYCGEIVATTLHRLGAVALVTDGVVRDLDEVRALGFQCFAAGTIASHGRLRIAAVMEPVAVGGLTVQPGDLLHGDQHGLLTVPDEVAKELPQAVQRILRREAAILEILRAPDFTLQRLKDTMLQR